jgi:hypothetical protein
VPDLVARGDEGHPESTGTPARRNASTTRMGTSRGTLPRLAGERSNRDTC